MKISIITVCYNSQNTIADTIESIKQQDYKNIELIIVDGASTDNTLSIIKSYGNFITQLISEPDKGIYDAMNKGILLATGDIIGILNSDDLLSHSKVLSNIHNTFIQSGAECLYGDLTYVKSSNTKKTVRYWKAGKGSAAQFYYGWAPPHPTFYVKKEVFKTCGLYRLDIFVAADYEFMLRAIVKYKKKLVYLPEVIVLMRLGGVSNNSFKARKKSAQENRMCWKVNNLKSYFFTPYLKIARKLIQFINH